MALLPGIALPPCSLGRCSATKIRDPLAVGRVCTSRLVYDPSSHLSCGILWFSYSHLTGLWLTPYCHHLIHSPRAQLSRLLHVGSGSHYALTHLACLTTRVFGTRLLFFALLPSGFCSLRRWFPVCFLLAFGWFFPSLYVRACSCGECSCGLSGGLFLSLGKMCCWSHTRGTWGGGRPWGGEDTGVFLRHSFGCIRVLVP